MTALRTLAVAVAAIMAEGIYLLLAGAAEGAITALVFDAPLDASYPTRVTGAVATFVLLCVTPAPVAFALLLRFGRRPGVRFLWAVFIVAVLNGLLWLPWVALVTWQNDRTWDVPFPGGGDGLELT